MLILLDYFCDMWPILRWRKLVLIFAKCILLFIGHLVTTWQLLFDCVDIHLHTYSSDTTIFQSPSHQMFIPSTLRMLCLDSQNHISVLYHIKRFVTISLSSLKEQQLWIQYTCKTQTWISLKMSTSQQHINPSLSHNQYRSKRWHRGEKSKYISKPTQVNGIYKYPWLLINNDYIIIRLIMMSICIL